MSKRSSPCGQSRTIGGRDFVDGDDVAPGVDGFLVERGVDRALEGEVVGQGNVVHGGLFRFRLSIRERKIGRRAARGG